MKNKPDAEAAVTPETAPQAQILGSLIDLSRPTVQPARTADTSLHNDEK
jgi:hypothetical protein